MPRNFCGAARLSRRFGCPSGLEPINRVFLVIDACQPLLRVSLAGVSLGPSVAAAGVKRYDITSLIEMHNQVDVDVERMSGDRGHDNSQPILGEVWLEITTDD